MTSEIKEQNKDVFKIAKIQKSYHPYALGDGAGKCGGGIMKISKRIV